MQIFDHFLFIRIVDNFCCSVISDELVKQLICQQLLARTDDSLNIQEIVYVVILEFGFKVKLRLFCEGFLESFLKQFLSFGET